MRRKVALLLPLALAWQISDLARVPHLGWRLDPPLVLVLLVALARGPMAGLGVGLAAGAAQDLLTGDGLAQGVIKGLLGMLAGALPRYFYHLGPLGVGLTALVATGLCEGATALRLHLGGRTEVWAMLPGLVLCIGPLHALLAALGRLAFQPREEPEEAA